MRVEVVRVAEDGLSRDRYAWEVLADGVARTLGHVHERRVSLRARRWRVERVIPPGKVPDSVYHAARHRVGELLSFQ